ncbi:MAG: aminopeptidase P N-terminal domain-containing protein [Bacteroidota bacterium]
MKYEALNPEMFKLHRRRFMQQLQPQSIAIFNSNDRMPRNGDQFFPFRQNSHFFYLCGIDQEKSVLVLFPDCVKSDFRELLFIRKGSEKLATWEGQQLDKRGASEMSGIPKVYWLEEMEVILHELILMAQNIYINTNENDHFRSKLQTRDLRFAQSLRERYPAHNYQRAQPILKKLGMLKSAYELPLIQHAIQITGQAFKRVCEFVRPGVMEYEIEAEIIHEFIRRRANGHAYSPIVASGANACVLHYNDNNQRCHHGEVLLLDFGAEYANYAADLSRCLPVSGRFSERQRQVYEAVLRVMQTATQLLVPGMTLEEYHKEVGQLMESELIGLKLLSRETVRQQNPDRPAYKKYFMHGTSHHLGLDVHDLADRYMPIQAGMVFTVEPGIYIPEEQLGIRLENNILVTDEGPIDLTANIPVEVEAIEELMNAQVAYSNG